MSVNKCKGCLKNCCVDFSIGSEVCHPLSVRDELVKFPFIKRTGSRLVRGPGGVRSVGVYNCDRFNCKTGECRDYETQPRPSFCSKTGEMSVPHSQCLLKSRR